MLQQDVKVTCSKCRNRLVLTADRTCVLCGFPQPVPKTLPQPVVTPIRAVPAEKRSPMMKEAITASYQALGLKQTAIDFNVKPSTLVMRLKRWGVPLHGRGWKPANAMHQNSGATKVASRAKQQLAHGTNGAHLAWDEVLGYLEELERLVTQSSSVCGDNVETKAYHTGRLEMVRTLRLLVRRPGSLSRM